MKITNKYRQQYALRGDRDSCGDWLSDELHGDFKTKHGRFDPDKFIEFLTLNGVDCDEGDRWMKGPIEKKRGWQGRFRMSGRVKLERALLERGFIRHLDGSSKVVPREFLEGLAAKYPNDDPTGLVKYHT